MLQECDKIWQKGKLKVESLEDVVLFCTKMKKL